MRAIPILAATFTALALSSVGARADGTWCAHYSGRGGGTNCGFHSFEQCRATVFGIGGFCQPNPFAYGSASSAYGSTRRAHRRNY
jgi:hypothetical protein